MDMIARALAAGTRTAAEAARDAAVTAQGAAETAQAGAETAAAEAAAEASTAASVVSGARSSAQLQPYRPNLVHDMVMQGSLLYWNGAVTTGLSSDKRPTITVTNTLRFFRIPIADLGGATAWSAGVDIESVTYVAGTTQGIFIRQLDSSGNFMSGGVSTLFGLSGNVASRTAATLQNIANVDGVAFLEFYVIANGNAGNSITFSLPGVYAGESAAYRGSFKDRVASPRDTARVMAGASLTFKSPNLLTVSTGTPGTRDGRETWTTTGIERFYAVKVADLKGATTFSVSAFIEALGYTSGGANQVFAAQYNASGALVGSAVTLSSTATGATFDPPRDISRAAIAVESGADEVRILVRANGNAANFIELSLLGIYAGESAAYRPPMAGGDYTGQIAAVRGAPARRDAPNMFPDPYGRVIGLSGNTVYNGGIPTLVIVNGRIAWRRTNAMWFVRFSPNLFGGAGAGTVSFTCRVEDAAYASGLQNLIYLRFYDASDVLIPGTEKLLYNSTGNFTQPQTPIKVEGVAIPAGTGPNGVSIEFNASGGAGNTLTVSEIGVYKGTNGDFRPAVGPERTCCWLSPDGSDANDGSQAAPFKTIQRAQIAIRDPRDMRLYGDIILFHGDYEGAGQYFLTCSQSGPVWDGDVGNVRVMAARAARPRIIMGNKLPVPAKTAGRTNVYEVTGWAASKAPTSSQGTWMFEHDTPWHSISLDERLPQHLGQTYRSPSTPLSYVESVALCDATPGSWYYDAGATTLYFHPPGSTDPTASGKSYYTPLSQVSYNATNGFGNGLGSRTTDHGKAGTLTVIGITVMYAHDGFDFSRLAWWETIDCTTVGSYRAGHNAGNASGIARNPRSLCDGGDGLGEPGVVGSGATSTRQNSRVTIINPYVFRAGDDGISTHERSNWTIDGGAIEYPNDGGIIPVLGSETRIRGTLIRKPFQKPASNSGEGLGIRQAPAADEGGVNNCVYAEDVIVEGAQYSFAITNAGGSNMVLVRPISRNAVFAGYFTLGAGARMDVYDGRTQGDALAKSAGVGTTLNVITTSALT